MFSIQQKNSFLCIKSIVYLKARLSLISPKKYERKSSVFKITFRLKADLFSCNYQHVKISTPEKTIKYLQFSVSLSGKFHH